MKRKFLILLFTVVLILIFSSCNKEENACTLVNEAIKNTLSIPYFELEWDRTFTTEAGSITAVVENIIQVKAENYNSENQKLLIINYSKNLDSTTLIYQEDDFYYISSDDGDFKYHKDVLSSIEDFAFIEYVCDLGNILVEYPEECFINAEILLSEDGMKTVCFEGLDYFIIPDSQIEITINQDGYISVCKISYSDTVDGAYTTFKSDAIEIISFSNPGKIFEVVPLEDYETFEEMP